MKISPLLLMTLILILSAPATVKAVDPPQDFYSIGNWHVYGDSPNYLDLGLGVFDVGSNNKNNLAGQLQLRIGKKLWFIGPAIGILGNLDGGYYAYGGIYAEIAWKNLVFTPVLAAGAYEEGAGKDLGGTFQFRTSLGVAYQFDNLSRFGLQIAHISNADLLDYNPGEEEIYLTFAWPF
jgi:lipid A 3-O-deacylase